MRIVTEENYAAFPKREVTAEYDFGCCSGRSSSGMAADKRCVGYVGGATVRPKEGTL